MAANRNVSQFVDIHGRDVNVTYCEKTGDYLVPLSEIKKSGFSIFNKKQYNKLLIDEKLFTKDFNLYMLEAAQRYALESLYRINRDEILESIENCKKVLLEEHSSNKTQQTSSFINQRTIEESSDQLIHIKVPTQNTSNFNNNKIRAPRHSASTHHHDRSSNHSTLQDSTDLNRSFESSTISNQTPSRPISFDQVSTSSRSSQNSKDGQQDNRRKPLNQGYNRDKNDYSNNSPNNKRGVENGEKFVYPKYNGKIDVRYSKDDIGKEVPPTVLLDKKFHDVIVCHVERANCVVWARDVANDSLFEDLFNRIEQEAKSQSIIQKPVLNRVYLVSDGNYWHRCKVVGFQPLRVQYLDYGNIEEVESVRDIPQELAKIPCQAIRITYKNSNYELKESDEVKVKPALLNKDGTVFVHITNGNVNGKLNDSLDSNFANISSKQPSNNKVFFKMPPYLCRIENYQRVYIVGEEDGKFFLRTRDCSDKLKEVENNINSSSFEPLDTVKKGQLVMHADDGNHKRALVLDCDDTTAKIKCLDFCCTKTVPVDSLRHISEALSQEPITYFVASPLKSFSGKAFGEKCKRYIKDCIDTRKKFNVVLEDANDFDLKFNEKTFLSEQLQVLNNEPLPDQLQGLKKRVEKEPSDRIMLDELEFYAPESGLKKYLCVSIEGIENATFLPNDQFELYADKLVRCFDNTTPYKPIRQEVCYGLFDGDWYRCVVTREINDAFETLFLDFGNIEVLDCNALLKPDKSIKEIPVLGLPCKFFGLPNRHDIEKLLMEHVIANETYEASISGFNQHKFNVEIPSVYEKLKQ